MKGPFTTIDGNEAAAAVAYQASEVIAIYPITPSSTMGELSDQWASQNKLNLWGSVPSVVEMQSEGGAAGALHGALQAGALCTSFTSSQGLLLMLPNMYKIAGELTPFALHVAARTVAAHALSIFGDHSDVMGARMTGFALLSSASVQEAADFALIAHAATLEARVPFMHFFDGFRTSHEIAKIEMPGCEVMRAMLDEEAVRRHRGRALTPDRPSLRGTAQNPDVFFQSREAANPYYLACPALVQGAMDKFEALTGRAYRLFDYFGSPDAERVIILMGSGAEAAKETAEALAARGQKVGVLQVRLYRPFDVGRFLASLPASVRSIAVLDRTKEPGSSGDPLYLDVVAAISESAAQGRLPFANFPRIVGGRYGLSSKEFTPAMVKAVYDNLENDRPRNHFTIGIHDDVTHASLDFDPAFSTEDPAVFRAVFYGLGADGTVGANKNSIKIIGKQTDNHVQGYFVYDSKKSGSLTISHLRFGPHPIRASYLIEKANFVACHQFAFVDRLDILEFAEPGATFLLNSPYPADEVWDHLPRNIQERIVRDNLQLHVIDADAVSRAAGLGSRINTVMQTCFFLLCDVLPREKAVEAIKDAIRKTYRKAGVGAVECNFAAVDAALDGLERVWIPVDAREALDFSKLEFARKEATQKTPPESGAMRRAIERMLAGKGDSLPVSAMSADGAFPTGTARWEKRNLAQSIPVWDEDICIQCGKCVLVCPHAVIRGKVFDADALDEAPPTFKSAAARWRERPGQFYALQVAPEDCTGCELCVQACPVKSKTDLGRKALNMAAQAPLLAGERENWDFFMEIPQADRANLNLTSVKDVQLCEPLFEFSGACAGCGETPYLKLLSQLFGDRAMIANATGCSSIYGGNLPTTPWCKNHEGRGPAWANSLFEDNAEFGLGMRVALDAQSNHARMLLARLAPELPLAMVGALLKAEQTDDAGIAEQRERVAALKDTLAKIRKPEARELADAAEALVKKTVWIVGGDGWAYDIGFGGLDHVLASGLNINVLVLDTEVYSNTGGQASKSTPRGAVAKFAAKGKPRAKKDLAMMAATYGNVYIAKVAMGANDSQTVRAFLEAEAYDGPSLILAYSPCIAHGIDMIHSLDQQKAAVQCGHWPLLRFNPDKASAGGKAAGANSDNGAGGASPLTLDCKPPSLALETYLYGESRYAALTRSNPEEAKRLLALAKEDIKERWEKLEEMAGKDEKQPAKEGAAPGGATSLLSNTAQ